MQATQHSDGTLTLYYDGSAWAKFLFTLAAVSLVAAAYLFWAGENESERFQGLLLGVLILVIGGFACLETALVKIDPRSQTIRWSKRIAVWKTSGKLGFQDVKDVVIQSPTGTIKVPFQRIALQLQDGTLMPLTYGARPDDGRLRNATALCKKALHR